MLSGGQTRFPLREVDPLRGNTEFCYFETTSGRSEERLPRVGNTKDLSRWFLRVRPRLLGPGLKNQITDCFPRRAVIAVRGSTRLSYWTVDLARSAAGAGEGRRAIQCLRRWGALVGYDCQSFGKR